MKIKFIGELDIPDCDSKGDADVCVLLELERLIVSGKESDEIYDSLKLNWEVV